ncbi:unnamed protein product [Chrysoparadoxa australica]
MTLFYSIYFTEYVDTSGSATSLYGASVALSILMIGLLAPFVGTRMDLSGQRIKYLRIFAIGSVLGTVLLGAVGLASPLAVSAVFVFTNTAFGLSVFAYDSLVIDFSSSRKSYTKLSGLGWALGYIGGPMCRILALIILGKEAPATVGDFQIIFIITGIFFAVFAAPLVLLKNSTPTASIKKAHSPFVTLWRWKENREAFLFLGAVYLFSDALVTIIYFVALYGREVLHLELKSIIFFMVYLQIVAVPATVIITRWANQDREISTLIFCICMWAALVFGLYFATSLIHFYVIGALTGLVVGSTPAIARGYLAKIIPSDMRSEFFGFNAVAGRLASLVGPIIFTVTAAYYGMRIAVLTVLPFLLGAMLLLVYLKIKRGRG